MNDIEKKLNKLSESLYCIYKKVVSKRIPDFSHGTGYPSHGGGHVSKVAENIFALIGNDFLNKLDEKEIFILLCAIHLHDGSMSYGIRNEHAKETGKFVYEYFEDIITDETLRSIIADVIIAHGENDLKRFIECTPKYSDGVHKYAGGSVCAGLLMALLRMGDLMDWCKDRAPELMREKKPIVGENFHHWYIHRLINHIKPSRGKDYIEVSCEPVGPYSAKLMKDTLNWFNEQLNSNRTYLQSVGLNYQDFRWHFNSGKRIEKALQIDTLEANPFKPFDSYSDCDYLKLFGRDEDAKKITLSLLEAGKHGKVMILSGNSGVGKTSILKGRILQNFKEYDFATDYICDYTDFSATLPDGGSGRKLIILDQLERAHDLEQIIEKIKDLIASNKKICILISITTQKFGELASKVRTCGFGYSDYFLRHVDSFHVVGKILESNGINFDCDLIKEIIDALSRMTNIVNDDIADVLNDDITNVHIIFKGIIDKDVALLCNKDNLSSRFGSIEEMCVQLLNEFFQERFLSITDLDKKLLQRACNEQGNGTRRASSRTDEEITAIKNLSVQKIVRYFDNGEKYEFLHDLLAQYYYKHILSDYDKKIKNIMDIIQELKLIRVDTLMQIQDLKEDILREPLNDGYIFNLAFSYMETDAFKYNEDILYWISRIKTPSGLVDFMLEKLAEKFDFNQLSCFESYLMHYLNEKDANARDLIYDALVSHANQKENYIKRNASRKLLTIFDEYENIEEDGNAIIIGDKYKQICIDSRSESFLDELYHYCKVNNILDSICSDNLIKRTHLDEIYILIKAFADKQPFSFYATAYNFNYKKDLINSNIKAELLKKIANIANVIIETNENSIFETGRMTPTEDGKHNFENISTSDGVLIEEFISEKESAEWQKFCLATNIKLFAIKKAHKLYEPIFVVKEQASYSEFFSKNDVDKIIWKCKAKIASTSICQHIDTTVRLLKENLAKTTDSDMKYLVVADFIKEYHDVITRFFDINDYCKGDNQLNNVQLKYLYGTLLMLDFLSSDEECSKFLCAEVSVYLKCKNIKDSTIAMRCGFFDSFYISFQNGKNIDPDGIAGIQDDYEGIASYKSPISQPSIDIRDVSNFCPAEIHFSNNSSPILVIYIGNKLKKIVDLFVDSFSFSVGWEDRISNSSKAIDLWEYEIIKLLLILQNNAHIKNILVVGPENKCLKSINFLRNLVNSKIDKDSTSTIVYDQLNAFYHVNNYDEIFHKIKLEIIDTEKMANNNFVIESISDYFSRIYANIEMSRAMNVESLSGNDTREQLRQIARDYLSRHAIDDTKIHNIRVKNINDAHKCIVAALINYGSLAKDAHDKDIYELHGVSLTIENVSDDNCNMLFRRDEIDEYYKAQWLDKSGEIHKYIDSHAAFDIKQKSLILEILIDSINKKRSTRKIAFTFYNPEIIKNDFDSVPSLFNCFFTLQFKHNKCIIDVFFVWRTNECVLGLPLSLESCIRWINEIILPEVCSKVNDVDVCIDNYTYYGINMHCFNDEIMANIIKKLLAN